jgi:hypothetical protein
VGGIATGRWHVRAAGTDSGPGDSWTGSCRRGMILSLDIRDEEGKDGPILSGFRPSRAWGRAVVRAGLRRVAGTVRVMARCHQVSEKEDCSIWKGPSVSGDPVHAGAVFHPSTGPLPTYCGGRAGVCRPCIAVCAWVRGQVSVLAGASCSVPPLCVSDRP